MEVMEPKPDIWVLRSETNRITKDHSCHLLTLSAIFLLPLSCFYIIYTNFSFQLLNHFYYHQNQPTNLLNPLFLYLLYSIFVMFFSICGVSSITYSVFHAFYGTQPFNLVSSIKSISTSFFPLLATTIVLKLIFFFIPFLFSLLFFLFILGTQFLGITITSSPYFLGFSTAVLVFLPTLSVMMYLQVRWILVPVVVVLEPCWGLEALRRSASLIKGRKKVALILLLFFGLMEGFVLYSFPLPVLNISLMGSENGIGRRTFDWWHIVLDAIGKYPLLMLYLLFNNTANTVLYILCKGIHDEDKCGNNYVTLPLDDNV
ncbi:unnamed protein product [Lupinus luteus]|uniref:Transmembrane protein n=1 Tax=Lupinus luteus TaxID=3873 RepID=A0AAV1WSB5_LUPLU